MALFSRRKKTDEAAPGQVDATGDEPGTGSATNAGAAPAGEPTPPDGAAADASAADGVGETASDPAPSVGISVQAFRGVGAAAGPEVAPPSDGSASDGSASDGSSPGRPVQGATRTNPAVPAPDADARTLPLAPATPPKQTQTVDGLNDNVLLREALAQIEQGASNEQLLGVLRQSLQGHLYLRVHGDARRQLADGKPLSVGMLREGERTFLLAFSSGAALRAAVQGEADPAATSAVAQPVTAVYQQVVNGEFNGIIIDNASAPHRVVLPTEILQQALSQADPELTVKTLVSGPREADTAAKIAQALATTNVWVAVNDGSNGQPVGVAEAHTVDGRRFLQVFSHPLEVVALGRNERPMPFAPEQIAKVLKTHPEVSGVLVDSAGPSIVLERDALGPVLVLAAALPDA